MANITIIGAGPGGLTAGMLLSQKHNVTIYEKNKRVGGRNSSIQAKGYTFDLGPTFLMMKFILDKVFSACGKKCEDYFETILLDPMYQLQFKNKQLNIYFDKKKIKKELKKFNANTQYERFLKEEKNRYNYLYPCLEKPYSTFSSYLNKDFLKALPNLALTKSLYQNLSRYYSDEEIKLSFTFQAKYLGMSPWNCPAAFTIIPYVEHAFGIYHVTGGLSKISEGMAKVIKEKGTIRLNTPVKKLILEGKKVTGVLLENGKKIMSDAVIINADFAHAMKTLLPPNTLRKYSPEKLKRKKYSCSTFMLYLGVNKLYKQPHHKIIFASDYKKNLELVSHHKNLDDDFSLYVRNASITDKTLAPKGHSSLYILIPVANNKSSIRWEEEQIRMRDKALDILEANGYKDLRKHITYEKIITPKNWEERGVYLGAVFNLAHTLNQMLYMRPRNKFEELDNCYLVGGGTHPGSGLPTIYESGRITAKLINQHF